MIEHKKCKPEHILVLDNENRKFALCLYHDRYKTWDIRVLKYLDLLDYELNEDGKAFNLGKV